MRVDFPSNQWNEVTLKDASLFHQNLFDQHLQGAKIQSNGLLFAIKSLMAFFGISFAFLFFRQNPDIHYSYLMGVICAGVPLCLGLFIRLVTHELKNDHEIFNALRNGKKIEDAHPSIQSRFFSSLEQGYSYSGIVFFRIAIFGVIAISTAVASTFLALNFGPGLSITIAALSMAGFIYCLISFFRKVKLIKSIAEVG